MGNKIDTLEVFFVFLVVLILCINGAVYLYVYNDEIEEPIIHDESITELDNLPESDEQIENSTDEDITDTTKEKHTAIITITFDDGWRSQYTRAYPLFRKYGMKATAYIIPDVIGRNKHYMSMDELHFLQDNGWDISTHPHPTFANNSKEQIEKRFTRAVMWFKENGFEGYEYFAYPFGYFNDDIIKIARKHFRNARTTRNIIQAMDSIDSYTIGGFVISEDTDFSAIKKRIDQTKENGEWLVIILHKIEDDPKASTEITAKKLDQLLSYINSTRIEVKTMSEI